jgi:hypothetical protein
MMAFRGVRNSWLILARKLVLARDALSARSRASISARSCALRSEMSRVTATMSAASLWAGVAGRQRISAQT